MNATETKVELTRTADVQAGAVSLEVINPHGDVSISTTEADSIEVVAGVSHNPTALDEATIALLLTLRGKDNNFTLEMGKPARDVELRVDLLVKVPRRTALTLKVNLGNATISGAESDVDIKANLGAVRLDGGSGAIVVKANAGAVDLHNVNPTSQLKVKTNLGDICYQGDLAAGENSFESDNGSIDLALPAATRARFDVETNLGRFYTDFEYDPVSNSFGDQTATNTTSGSATNVPILNIHTNLGDISVRHS